MCFQVRLAAPIAIPTSPAASSSPHTHADVAGVPPAALLGPNATNQFHWGQLESEDYKVYIARLRAIGCPPQTIRDIIISDLDKLMAPELRTAYGRRTQLKYWHPEEEELLNDVDPAEVFRRERELDKRKQEIIQELVQADLLRERMKASGVEDYYERRLKFLPEERRTQVRQLLERFDEAEQQVRQSTEAGGLSGVDREQIRVLRQQREHELDGLLTAQEKQLYELWISPLANEVRHSTYGMDATEQEFQAIYQARKAYEDAWGQRETELLDSATQQEMEQAREQRDAQIQASLGDERYTAYQRGQDHDFHLLSALVTRFKLPREKAAEVYGYKVVTATYRTQVANDPNLTVPQKEEAIRAIGEETRKSVRATLGSKAYHHYVSTGQGAWMNSQ
jgi:hypothetical protein